MVSFQDMLNFYKVSKDMPSSSSEARITNEEKLGITARTNRQGLSTNDEIKKEKVLSKRKKFVTPVSKDTNDSKNSERAHMLEILNNNKPKTSKNKTPVVTPEDITIPVITKEVITAPKIASKVNADSSMTPDFKLTQEETMTGSVMTQDTVVTSADDIGSSYEESLVANQPKTKPESGVSCNLCSKKFKNKKILKKHVKRTHLKLPNVCSKCSKVYPTEKTLHKHYISVHVSHECKLCKAILKNAHVMRSHLYRCKVKKETSDTDNQDKAEFKCSECTKVCKTDQEYQEHVAKIHVQQTCQHCEKNFKNKDILRVHLYKCKIRKEALSQDTGGDEIAVKEKQGAYEKVCALCHKKFDSKSGYYKHMKKIHKNNGDMCDVSDVGEIIIVETLADNVQGEVPLNDDIYVFQNV